MSNKPKISILIAVYNGGEALRKSIGSLQKQTLKDIEIVCVNDYSTDNSVEIINEYSKEDTRVKLVSFAENRGTICARKAGVEAATGEYIMFMDQDDEYLESACEELYNLIKEKDVDILHYRSKVVPMPPTTEKSAAWQEAFLHPYDGFLYGKDVFEYCFKPHDEKRQIWNLYTWNVWNKIYKTELCKEAMKECSEDYVINGDDVYVYMLIAYYAKSYFGDAQGKYYHVYSYGTGLMGHYKLPMSRFYTICRRMTGYRNEEIFLENKGKSEEYADVLAVDFCRALNGIVTRWYNRLSDEDHKHGFDMMLEHLSYIDVIKGFHHHVKTSYDNITSAVIGSKNIAITKNEVKNVAVYFSKDTKVPRSITLKHIEKLEENGIKVTILTENGTNFKFRDYKYIELPQEKEGKVYEYPLIDRITMLDNVLKENNIDAFIYTGRKNKYIAYDYLTVKCNGIPFIMDASELSLYAKNSNKAYKDYHKYLKFLCNVDGIFAPNVESEEVLKVLGAKYNLAKDMFELFADITAEGYSQNRNYDIAKDIAFAKAFVVLKERVESEEIKRAILLESMYEETDKKAKKKVLKTIANADMITCEDVDCNSIVNSAYNDIKEVMNLLNEYFDISKVINIENE